MNVYLLSENGEPKCIQAESMQEAITIGSQQFCKENYDDSWHFEETPDRYYQQCILQSCALIGELANP